MIPVYRPSLLGNEIKYVNECLDSGWISSRGEFVERFENGFGDFIGANHLTSVSNGTTALHLAIEVLNLGEGDEVIVPTFTYVASVNTILQAGSTPVFVDSLEETWQIDPRDIERKITPKTKAIMAVHLYGLACDLTEIKRICDQYNLFLIEDCAEAFGSLYNGQHVGTFGDVATFSFFGNKTITTGEGGMVIARSGEIIERVRHLKNQAVSRTKEYWHDTLGYNYRMTNICAAIGLAQIERAEDIISRKREIAQLYEKFLTGLPLSTHKEQLNTKHSYWMCSILLDNPHDRTTLRSYLKQNGIETRPFFYPAHTLPHCQVDAAFPIADNLSASGINLPSYPDLTIKDIKQIADTITNYFQQKLIMERTTMDSEARTDVVAANVSCNVLRQSGKEVE